MTLRHHLRSFVVASLAFMVVLLCSGQSGERVEEYALGSTAAGYVLRTGLPPARLQGAVQARDAGTQRLRIGTSWVPIAQAWKPIAPASISQGPGDGVQRMAYGTPLWGVLLRDPDAGGGYAGEVTLGAYGGHRWTSLGRLVVCVWRDPARKDRVPDCGVSGTAYRRIHVENVALRRVT